MKKITWMAVLILIVSASAYAQPKVYLNGFYGYTFDESVSVNGFNGKINDGGHYGGSLEFVLAGASTRYNERTIELTYQGQSTTFDGYVFTNGAYRPRTYNAGINFATLGINNYFGKTRKVMGFGGVAMGAVWANNKDNDQSVTKFAINLKGGGRFMFSDNIGLKLYAQLNTAVGGIGGGFYFGTGGAGAGVSTYSTAVQFGLGGGLTIGLGGSKPATK